MGDRPRKPHPLPPRLPCPAAPSTTRSEPHRNATRRCSSSWTTSNPAQCARGRCSALVRPTDRSAVQDVVDLSACRSITCGSLSYRDLSSSDSPLPAANCCNSNRASAPQRQLQTDVSRRSCAGQRGAQQQCISKSMYAYVFQCRSIHRRSIALKLVDNSHHNILRMPSDRTHILISLRSRLRPSSPQESQQ